MTLGSLFSGSGGFELAGMLNGIEPIWASEIEPFPLAVTAARLPSVQQLGDVTRINGAEIPPVDIITFGSPCQDLSTAGRQAGITGSRSSLFFEAIRIIKEMRDATNGKYPRFAVWENVSGAFSSNGGADFRAVLEALCQVKEQRYSVPQPDKWQHAGFIVGDDFSIAWRQYDAQFWGVPQRRKRIYCIADFGSQRAGQILFERESVSGDSAQGERAWQGITGRSADRAGEAVCFRIASVNGNNMKSNNPHSGYFQTEICNTLDARTNPDSNQGGTVVICIENHPADSRVKLVEDGTVQTLSARMGTGGVMYQ